MGFWSRRHRVRRSPSQGCEEGRVIWAGGLWRVVAAQFLIRVAVPHPKTGRYSTNAASTVTPSSFHAATACTVIGTMKRSEEHTSELQSLMRISYAVFCWKK